MKGIFIDKQDNYRIGWKIAFAVTLYVISSLLSAVIASAVYQNIHISSFPSMTSDIMNPSLNDALSSVTLIILLYLVFHIMSKGHQNYWNNLGFSGSDYLKMVLGGFMCAAMFCSMYIIPLYFVKQLEIEFVLFTPDILLTLIIGLIIFTGVSFSEEIIFRGYIQSRLSEKYEDWLSILITALLFAVLHLANSSYSLLSLVYLFISGIALSLMRIATKGIWFPLGFHLAWNWSEITVFGLGNNEPLQRWLFTSVETETIWTGNNGSSGLAVILSFLSIIGLLMCIKTKRKGEKSRA